MATPKEKYHLEFAKDKEGEDIPFRFMLVTSKPVKDKAMAAQLVQLLQHTLQGIDNFEIHGRYTIDIIIARTFDPDEVLEDLKRELDILLSEIIQRPNEIVVQ